MNGNDADRPCIWLQSFTPVVFLCAMIVVAASQAHARDAGDGPQADPAQSAELGAILSWAFDRLEAGNTWDQRLSEQRKSVERISREIDRLTRDIEARRRRITKYNNTDFPNRVMQADEKIHNAAAELEAARDRSRSLPPNLVRLVLESAEVALQNARQEREYLEKYTRRKDLDMLEIEVTDLEDRVSDLKKRRAQERSKLEVLESQAKTAELSDQELEVLDLLDETIRLRDKGQRELADKSLVEATRLWRQEMADQFKSRYREIQQRPGNDRRGIRKPPPGR
jgi:DNA repair exonuclease SbcCD ATPase subunit